jgi:hypothetical protein
MAGFVLKVGQTSRTHEIRKPRLNPVTRSALKGFLAFARHLSVCASPPDSEL